MPQQVVNGATLMCTMGLGPAVLTVAPVNGVLAGKQPAATIMDHIRSPISVRSACASAWPTRRSPPLLLRHWEC